MVQWRPRTRLGWLRLAALVGAFFLTLAGLLCVVPEGVTPLDPVPARHGAGALAQRRHQAVLHLSGTPQAMGRQHGTLLRETIRFMLSEYIEPALAGTGGDRLRAGAARMRAALPAAWVEELDACAAGAGVDSTALLLAQCIGDLEAAAARAGDIRPAPACSSFAAFGPATRDGALVCGRNLDYGVSPGLCHRAQLVTYYTPAPGMGHRFVAVGLAGMLTGWTLCNQHGLVVANHLGGGSQTRLDGVPTLLLARQVAQHAATVEEGIALLRRLPRMRGQILWLAQDAAPGRPARAVAVEYDAASLAVREAESGVLVVTNVNRVLGGSVSSAQVACGRYQRLQTLLAERFGQLGPEAALTLDLQVAGITTLHVVQVSPRHDVLRIWQGRRPAHWGHGVPHPLP